MAARAAGAPDPLLDTLHELAGVRGRRVTTVVEAGAVADFARALGLGPPPPGGVAPPAFCVALPYERPPLPLGRDNLVLNLANWADFSAQPRIGEPVTTEASLGQVTARGTRVTLSVEVRYLDAGGRRTGLAGGRLVFDRRDLRDLLEPSTLWWPEPPGFAERAAAARRAVAASTARWDGGRGAAVLAPGAPLPRCVTGPVDVDRLVLFSDVLRDYNPVHFDAGTAAAQGMPGILVPGIFKMCLLAQYAAEALPAGWRLAAIRARYHGIDLAGTTFTITGAVDREPTPGAAVLQLAAAGGDGEVSTTAVATAVPE